MIGRFLQFAAAIVCLNGCISATIKATLTKTGDSNNSTNGGCVDQSYTSAVDGSDQQGIDLVDFTVSSADLQKSSSGADALKDVGGFCIEAFDSLTLTGSVTAVGPTERNPDTCQGQPPGGTFNIDHFTVTDATSGNSQTVSCAAAQNVSIDQSDLQAALQTCLDGVAGNAAFIELVRKAINGSKHSATITGTGGCSAGACFNVSYSVTLRVTALVQDGGCK